MVIRDSLVLLGAPRKNLGSFGYVWLIRGRPLGRRVHMGSLGLFGRAAGVVKIIRVH